MYLVIRDAAGTARSRHEGHDEVARAASSLGKDTGLHIGLHVGRIRVGSSGRQGLPTVTDAAALAGLHRLLAERALLSRAAA